MPIPVEVLKRVSVVYTHAHCPDGMASAMILKDAFRMLGTSPRIEFLAHGTPEHKNAQPPLTSEYVLFCDIAPWMPNDPADREVRLEMMRLTGRCIVLDHHKGVEELVRSFGEFGVFADEKLEPGVSGAVLAFREVWWPIFGSGEFVAKSASDCAYGPVEDFALCVGARDTWQTQDPRFQRGQWISKMLMARPAEYWLRDGSNPYLTDIQINIGMELFAQHEEAVRQAVDQCVELTIPCAFGAELRLFVFQEQASGFRLTSDVAEAIRNRPPHFQAVVAGFSYVIDKPGAAPRLLYSLRGLGGFDVARFAKANGGGGHTAAAGFSVATRDGSGVRLVGDPYLEIEARLEQFVRRAP